MAKPERTVLAIGGAVLALVVVAVVIALTLGETEPEVFPPGSPEAQLQAYVTAVRNADRDAALALLTARARARVEDDQFFPSPYCGGDDRRVRVTHTTITGDRATIEVTIQETSSSLFDFDQYEYTQIVPMAREGGQWLVDEPYVCF